MAIPEKIGRYIIKSELGRGGMATVYRAHDPSVDREVAIKVLPREMLHDPQFRSRFEREIKMVAALEHPSIVPIYDVGDEDGQPYFVMRYMTGGSLSDGIEKGKFSVQDTARIIEKIAKGLAYSHRKGIIHRDLKPDNILFDDNGDPFISDFGVAKLTESGGGLTGSGVIGTPAYMSPEQAQGNEIDSRSDVYGLGVIIYQMLSGQRPYSADTPMGVVVKHITEPVPEILNLIPNLPHEVDALIKTAMAKDRNQRYATTIDLAKALNLIAFGHEGDITFNTNTGIGHKAAGASTTQFGRGKTGLIIAGIVLLVAVVGFFLLRNQLLVPDQPTLTATLPATEEPTLVTFTVEPTEEVVLTPTLDASAAFAPACTQDIDFPKPDLRITDYFCQTRIPYASVTIPEGASYELQTAAANCTYAGINKGRQVLTCSGSNFLVIDIKVCTPPLIAEEDLGKCSTDGTYNSEGSCCVAVPQEDAGCIVEQVTLKGCE
ncbi:MAG: serine/threonine protein kinase [Anaerolineales bacterium]|nr:serine/threonine protein kinase [Anaerolineales bacterium]